MSEVGKTRLLPQGFISSSDALDHNSIINFDEVEMKVK